MMPRWTLCWRAVLCLVALLIVAPQARAFAAEPTLGVFPFRVTAANAEDFGDAPIGQYLADQIGKTLKARGFGTIALTWPQEEEEGQPVAFITLLAQARDARAPAVLVGTVTQLAMEVKEQRIPLVGTVKTAKANMRLDVSVVDTAQETTIANIIATGEAKSERYGGLDLSGLGGLDLNSDNFSKSLPGQVCRKALDSLGDQLAKIKDQIPATLALPPMRSDAPPGAAFSQTTYAFSIRRDYDQWAYVEVTNSGDTPQRFVVDVGDHPAIMPVGFMGMGGPDQPCSLAPHEWKRVRLVATAPNVPGARVELPVRLFLLEEGAAYDPSAKPHDEGTVVLNITSPAFNLSIKRIAQNPETLAQTFLVANQGPEIPDLTLAAEGGLAGQVTMWPWVSGEWVGEGESFQVEVTPHVYPGFHSLSGVLVATGSGQRTEVPLDFSLPEGQELYLGVGRSEDCGGGRGSFCTNNPNPKIKMWGSGPETKKKKEGEGDDGSSGFFPKWLDNILSGRWPWDDGKGARIRPNVAKNCPEYEEDTRLHPSVVAGDKWAYATWFTPREGRHQVYAAVRDKGEEDSLEVRVVSGEGDARWPSIALGPDGTAYLAWEEARGGEPEVFFSKADAGSPGWLAGVALTKHGEGAFDPVVRADPEGKVIVLWEDHAGGESAVLARISTDKGETFGEPVRWTESDERATRPGIRFTPGGAIQLVYVQERADHGVIVTRTISTSGEPGRATVLSDTSQDCGEPDVLVLPDGTVLVAYRQGNGDDAKVYLVRGQGTTWEQVRQLTAEGSYAEYPVFVPKEEVVAIAYHSDSSGVSDHRYIIESKDGGRTFGPPYRLPSNRPASARAWLEAQYILQWPRATYLSYSQTFIINGQEVGSLLDMVPEGTYIFPVDPAILNTDGQFLAENELEIRTFNTHESHYIRACNFTLVLQSLFTEQWVVADSQEDADQRAERNTARVNHSLPDVGLFANPLPVLPAAPNKGQVLNMQFWLANIGEGEARNVVVYASQADASAPKDLREKGRLGEPLRIASLPAGEQRTITLRVPFQLPPSGKVSVYAELDGDDFDPRNNSHAITFTAGERKSPLAGMDYPDILQSPALMQLVDLGGFQDLVPSLKLEIPSLRTLIPDIPLREEILRRLPF